MKRAAEEPRAEQGGSGVSITPELPLCKCGRGPWRKGQRNCQACNREANRKYRISLKWSGRLES